MRVMPSKATFTPQMTLLEVEDKISDWAKILQNTKCPPKYVPWRGNNRKVISKRKTAKPLYLGQTL